MSRDVLSITCTFTVVINVSNRLLTVELLRERRTEEGVYNCPMLLRNTPQFVVESCFTGFGGMHGITARSSNSVLSLAAPLLSNQMQGFLEVYFAHEAFVLCMKYTLPSRILSIQVSKNLCNTLEASFACTKCFPS